MGEKVEYVEENRHRLVSEAVTQREVAIKALRDSSDLVNENRAAVVEALRTEAWARWCPTIAYVAVVFILNEGMESASPDFFRATAEIIPVLLLALIIEAGALRIEGRGRIDIVANCVTAGYLIAGLTFSLYNLGEDSTRHADVVWASMAAGVAGLLVAAILGRQPKAAWGPSSKRADSP
jgi:hypothetical protein